MTAKHYLRELLLPLHQYLLGEDRQALSTAYQVAKQGTEACPAHVWLYLYHVWLCLETGRISTAEGLLHTFRHALGSYSQNADVTSFYHFLVGLAASTTDDKVLKKTEDTLVSMALAQNQEHAYHSLLAYLYRERDPLKSHHYAETSFVAGCRSPLMYHCLHKSLLSGRRYYRPDMALSFIRWACTHGVLTADLLDMNRELIQGLVSQDTALFTTICHQHDLGWLLQALATCLAASGETSWDAYTIYKKFEQKQLFDEPVNRALMKAAAVHGVSTVSKFAMLSFIKSDLAHLTLEEQPLDSVLPYVFHMLLTLPTLTGMVKRHQLEPLLQQVAVACVNQPSEGRERMYHNSLFAYVLTQTDVNTLDEAAQQQMLFHLFEDCFAYVFTFVEPMAQVMVSEPLKKTPQTYPIEAGKAVIYAVTPSFQLLCFDGDAKLKQVKPTLEKRVSVPVTLALCEMFYRNKLVSPDLLLHMALTYIDNQLTSPQAIEVMSRAVKLKELTNPIKTKLNLVLGDVFIQSAHAARALEHYREVDIEQVAAQHVPHMFSVFLETKAYHLVLRVIQSWQDALSQTLLYQGVVDIVDNYLINSSRRKAIEQHLASAIATLLCGGHEHPSFLPILLRCYQGDVARLAMVSEALHKQGITYPTLDQSLLTEAIQMQNISPMVQQVFVRYYAQYPDEKLSSDFIYYLCYQLLTGSELVGTEMVSVIETLAMASDRPNYLLYLSLCMALPQVSETYRETIVQATLAYLDSIDVFFPGLMGLDSPHLSPRQATLFAVSHRAKPDQSVYLVLQIDGGEHQRIAMDYFRFGMYLASFPLFYQEEIRYYFEEAEQVSEVYTVTHTQARLKKDSDHLFFRINNALLYQEMFKHKELEQTLESMYRTPTYTHFQTLI